MQYFKDWIPAIIGMIALLLSYFNISRQIRKNHIAQWINDFRQEISNLLSLTALYSYNKDDKTLELLNLSVFKVSMFLNTKNKLQEKLFKKLSRTVVYSNKSSDEVGELISEISRLARIIIQERESKI